MRRPPEERPIIHRVPRWDDEGKRDGWEWCRTMTDATKFAKEQCHRLMHGGYTIESLPFAAVKDLLEGGPSAPEEG